MGKKSEISELRLAISELKLQVGCGWGCGHKFAIVGVDRAENDGLVIEYRFKCVYCDVEYWRNVDCLTDSEKSLVKAILG